MKPVYAVSLDQLPWGPKTLKDTFPSLSSLISLILNNALTIVGILLLLLLIFGGLTFIIGAGNDDPKKTQQGQQTITHALLGFAIVFSAYFIIRIIEILTGLDILNSNL